jgi:branched-chain amino acid transport system permease protein
MGRAGQVSLGQAGFLAVGAYTSAILVVRHGWNALAVAAVAVVVAALLGLVVGLPLLRLRGHYLALATLGFGIIVAVVANEWELTGATSGIYDIPKPAFNGRTYDSARQFFWLVWPLVLVATWLAANLVRGRVGRALAAVSDSEVAAQTLGVDTFRLRLQVLVGGLSSVWGAVLGAVFVQALGELLTIWVPRLIPGASGEYQLIGFGVVLAAAVVLPARAEEAAIEASARGLLDLLGLAEVADAPAGELPFGRQRLVEIARALATEPDLLLLDEPMAGL